MATNPPIGVPEQDRPMDPHAGTERRDVVRAQLERPSRRVVARGSAVVAKVEIDELGNRGQRPRVRLQVRVVVATRAAVE